MRRVLVVEDDPDIGRLVTLRLAELDCESRLVADGVAGLEEAVGGPWDLVILDIMLPRLDGLHILKRLRAAERHTPILMLTAKSTDVERVLGLELGADDYLTKPFYLPELAARVKGLFRRADRQASAKGHAESVARRVEADTISIDLVRHEATVEGRPVELTVKEFELLVYFAKSPGRVHTRAQLLDQIWGCQYSGYEHTINSHINRLRGKIERDPANPTYIQTVWGVGYKFADPRA